MLSRALIALAAIATIALATLGAITFADHIAGAAPSPTITVECTCPGNREPAYTPLVLSGSEPL